MSRKRRLAAALLLAALSMSSPAPAQEIREDVFDRLIGEAIQAGDTAGAVLLIGQGRQIRFCRAYGLARHPDTAMRKDTVFDLASLTKPMATAAAVMLLIQRGQIDLETRLHQHLPDVDPSLTVAELLLHEGGLVPDNPLSDYRGSKTEMWRRVLACQPGAKGKFVYSDVGYLMLGKLVEAVDGRPLDAFCRQELWNPLGMQMTDFGTRSSNLAATYGRPSGQVHDPRAHRLGGTAGHAGLFSTASDIAIYLQMLLGERPGPFSQETLDMMLAPRDTRTYGFDVSSPFASARGLRFSTASSCGHTGFTGTSFWLDRDSKTYVVLLCNRLHPDNQGSVVKLRSRVATAVAEQLLGPPLRCGVDVLVDSQFSALKGKRVGLITNHTGADSQGRRTIDLLHRADELELVRLFSPEHGLAGKLDRRIGDSVDSATGLSIKSLYGDSRRPNRQQLDDLDVLVFDIQDAGCRFYTYISTMLYALQAAAECNLEFVVLDRPNPLGGLQVDGWLAANEQLDFIACWPIPLVHGMTVGELALLFNAEVGAKLEVVRLEGWTREQTWDRTGLLWRPPSPNLRSLVQAHLYPMIGLLEWANLSVGRGTDQPFQRFGAPWIREPVQLAWELNSLQLEGLRFVPIRFTPTSSVFAGESCGGVEVILEDRRALRAAQSGLLLAAHLWQRYPEHFKLEKMRRHVANDLVLDALRNSQKATPTAALWSEQLEKFRQQRREFLLYR